MPIMTLRKRGPQVGHIVCCRVIDPEDVHRLIGIEHKELYFIVQAATVDSSRGVSIDQFRDNML